MAYVPRRRYAYALAYLLMACAGVAAAYWPAPSVRTATGGGISPQLYVWDAFLLVGGLASGFGAVTDRWVGEYIGLPLLVAVFGVYGVSAFFTALASESPASIAGGMALSSIALLFIGRWRDLGMIRRTASVPLIRGRPHGG